MRENGQQGVAAVFSSSGIEPDFEKDSHLSVIFLSVFTRGRDVVFEGGGVPEREREIE